MGVGIEPRTPGSRVEPLDHSARRVLQDVRGRLFTQVFRKTEIIENGNYGKRELWKTEIVEHRRGRRKTEIVGNGNYRPCQLLVSGADVVSRRGAGCEFGSAVGCEFPRRMRIRKCGGCESFARMRIRVFGCFEFGRIRFLNWAATRAMGARGEWG